MQILNTYNLPRVIILQRLQALDDDAQVIVANVYDELQNTFVSVITVETDQDVTTVNNLLQAPLTANESTFQSNYASMRSQIKTEYTNMINRLEQIQGAGSIPFTSAGFAQVVQAVKDEALYQERLLKFVKFVVLNAQ